MDRKRIIEYVYDCEEMIKEQIKEIDKVSFYNSMKVLGAFHKCNVNEGCCNKF